LLVVVAFDRRRRIIVWRRFTTAPTDWGWDVFRHLVFDCDGVLWAGTNEGYFRCYFQAAVAAGIPIDFDTAKRRILENWGQSVRIEIEGMIPDHAHLVTQVVRNFEQLVRSDLFLNAASPVPGADEALRDLSRCHALSAITGMNAENLTSLLDRFGWRGFFRHAISAIDTDDPAKQKPTGYHLGRLMEAERLLPHEVLCVGDAAADVQMAHSQGAPAVAVLTGHLTEPEARELDVLDVLPSVASLPAWLRNRSLCVAPSSATPTKVSD
jgi:phosphoglycolate phosphatase-like HAD superfamily hydrolase